MEAKMDRETYYMTIEQMGLEPDPDKIPPEVRDFPLDVQKALVVFNKLGDKIVADIGYLGKDFTSVDVHMRVNNVQNEGLFLETLLRLDQKVITKSAETMKRERDKIKAANNKR